MAIIQAAFAGIARSAGKILNTVFGWATVLLFGKVPEDRQLYLSGMTFGSVIWIVTLLGIAFPRFGAWMLTFATLPKWVDKAWIRWAMLAATLLLPLAIGFLSLLIRDPEDRPRGAEKLKAIVRGYPFTLGMAVTLVMMCLFAPIMMLRRAARRWATQHVPVIIEASDYEEVVGEIQRALAVEGRKTERQPATWMMRFPTRVLTTLAGSSMGSYVADELTTLVSKELEVVVHPSDLVIAGKEADAMHARGVIGEQLAFSKAYLTWDKEANELEDHMRHLWESMRAGSGRFKLKTASAELQKIEEALKKIDLPYEEWEILYREKLLVERGLLRAAAGITGEPKEPTDASSEQLAAKQTRTLERDGDRVHVPKAVAVAAFAALALLEGRD